MPRKLTLGQYIGLAFAFILAILSLLPLLWMFFLSGSRVDPESGAIHLDGAAFQRLVSTVPIWLWAFNSLVIALITTASNLLLGAMAGYAFAVKDAPGLRLLFWFCLATIMVPSQVTVIPLFLMASKMGLMNSYLGLVFPSLVSAFGVFLMRQFMAGIPRSLFEAARLDGCSEWMLFTRIALPMARPALAVLGLFSFTYSWNDFLWPLIVSNKRAMWTLPVGLASLKNEFNVDTSLLMAGASFAAIPMVLLFLGLQRHFVSGLTAGAVKG